MQLSKHFTLREMTNSMTAQRKGIELFNKEKETKPLPEGFSQKTPQPIINTTATANKNPITNLTRTEDALLSPTEKVIAGRT